ncbi:MAG: hypothetical protein QME74_01665, partial [Candidatus Edwardsbacteria bacterium]|nr:hypothetical protein [Candidatus Edwardsbacteria bacterium]
NGDKKNMTPQCSACDYKHRIAVKDANGAITGYMCCDSRSCLFKVIKDDKQFCVLEKPEDDVR